MNLKLPFARKIVHFRLLALAIALAIGPASTFMGHRAGAQSRRGPDPQVQAGCMTAKEVAQHWPPVNQGRIEFAQHDIDPSRIPFNQVHLMNIACGAVRGNSADDFIAYSVKQDYGRVRVLAAYQRDEKKLVNLGILVRPNENSENTEVLKVADLTVENLTGGTQPQVVFTAGDPDCASRISIWGASDGPYANLLTASDRGCIEISKGAGDGRKEIIFWDTPPEFRGPDDNVLISARVWPGAAYRWNGGKFLKVLLPHAYSKLTDFIEKNEGKIKDLKNDQDLLLAIGRAYEFQGNHAQALEQFAKAWDGSNYNYQSSDFGADWNDQRRAELVLSSFYGVMQEPIRLDEAYGRYAREIRSARSFADFAASMAYIEAIAPDGKVQVLKTEGNTITATIRLKVKELTQNGETERPYLATWQLRHDNCALLSGTMKPM